MILLAVITLWLQAGPFHKRYLLRLIIALNRRGAANYLYRAWHTFYTKPKIMRRPFFSCFYLLYRTYKSYSTTLWTVSAPQTSWQYLPPASTVAMRRFVLNRKWLHGKAHYPSRSRKTLCEPFLSLYSYLSY